MKSKSNNKPIVIFSVLFYILAIAMMILGSINDIEIDKALFNPQNMFAITFENIGLFVYWGIWGPIFTILFLTAHTFNECLEVLGRIIPGIKPIENDSKAFNTFNKLVKIIWQVAFFVLAIIGWKKIIENVAKKFVDLSQLSYFIICAVVATLAMLLFSKINKKTLNKLEGIALAGLLFGILLKIVESCKTITQRVRFREMVAASNGFFDEEGLSYGKLEGFTTRLTKDMAKNSNFDAFTPWYQMGKGEMGIYSHTDSFPSGHTFDSCAIFLSALVCNCFEKLKKYEVLAYFISGAYVITMAVTRLLTGAHYLTDVAGGAIVGYSLFLIVSFIYKQFSAKGILPTRSI